MITNATQAQINYAVAMVSMRYDSNVMVKEIEQISKNRVRFTLRVKDSKGKGAGRGYTGRRTVSACWHVHGHVFDEMIKIDPAIWIKAGAIKIDKNEGNWTNYNRGSQAFPVLASSCCECG